MIILSLETHFNIFLKKEIEKKLITFQKNYCFG